VGIQKTGGADPKPQSPVAPADSLKWLETQAGFRVELVAAEPQVVDPVSMQIDEQGRIWVVEMRDYPTEDDSPKSRIVVLQDNDRMGSMRVQRSLRTNFDSQPEFSLGKMEH
jgi:hypothetical protein